ncbi:MobA/MobL family protein [Salmonella enterica subsp. enterica]|uniref:MobA/MobL family protein n=1 Tax=Salmonella enterica I TaxID=59201 RepID=A0A379WCS3_SALET|nr:MobA/MobL family protein [Salmonella enterica subsp. enterica]
MFKRFTLLVVGFFKERFVWARRKPDTTDADHDKRIAENYVFDEVLGVYVSRSEFERPLSLTMTKHHKKQESMPTNQILTRLFISQIVLSKNKRRSTNTHGFILSIVENLL